MSESSDAGGDLDTQAFIEIVLEASLPDDAKVDQPDFEDIGDPQWIEGMGQDKKGNMKTRQHLPSVDLYRISTAGDHYASWFDAFLYATSQSYQDYDLNTQFKIVQNFRQFCLDHAKDIFAAFPDEWKPAFVSSAEEIVKALRAGMDKDGTEISPKLGFVIAWFFGVNILYFSFETFDDIQLLVEYAYQSKDCKVIFMMVTRRYYYEPLVKQEESEEDDGIVETSLFNWSDSVLCPMKQQVEDRADELKFPHFIEWEEPECDEDGNGVGTDDISWKMIDPWVRENYSENIGPKETIKPADPIDRLPALTEKEDAILQKDISAGKWLSILTAGDGTCMIHAALLAISPAYRSIPQAKRGAVGREFRTSEFVHYFKSPADIKLVNNTHEFLQTSHLKRFIDVYKINICVIAKLANRQTRISFMRPGKRFLNGENWIFIYNREPAHYSAIYLGAQAKFMLTEAEFIQYYKRITHSLIQDDLYLDIRQGLLKDIESSGADDVAIEAIRKNVQAYEIDNKANASHDIHALPARLDGWEITLGMKTGVLGKYKKPLQTVISSLDRPPYLIAEFVDGLREEIIGAKVDEASKQVILKELAAFESAGNIKGISGKLNSYAKALKLGKPKVNTLKQKATELSQKGGVYNKTRKLKRA